MALSKQAKTLNKSQINAVLNHLAGRRNALRNQVIFLLSVKAGLRAKEIAYRPKRFVRFNLNDSFYK